jgi:hypothetical protein
MNEMAKSNLAQVPENLNYTEADAIQALKSELEKGVESMEQDILFTIEEAWKEIDAI